MRLIKLPVFVKTLFLSTLLLNSLFAQAELKALDGIAVIVDDDVILQSEFDKRYQQLKQQFEEQKKNIPDEVLRSQLIERLILESLQLQMAQRAGATIPEEQLNYTLTNIAKSNGKDLPGFVKMLKAQGQDYAELREQVKNDLLIQRVQQGNLARKVKVSDDEIDAWLETEEGKDLRIGSYKLDHLLLPVSSSASDKEKALAKERIKQIRDYALKNKQKLFSNKLKKQFSDTRYSDLGWRKGSELPSLFTKIVPTLEPGQISQPISSSSGWHLVSIADKKGGSGQMVKQTRVRHILIQTNEVINDEKAEAQLKDIYQQIKDGADFAELAKEHSDDHGSALSGGDIGWQTPDALVPAFAQIMQHSKIGQLSEPFKSRFGWHILEVLERREHDISIDQARSMAYRILYKQKFDEELEAWLSKIRDEAFIDIKI